MSAAQAIFRSAACVLFGFVASGFAVPSLAGAAGPLRQSGCEIRANKFKADHPHAEPLDFMRRTGAFYFGGTVPPHPPPDYRDPQSGIIFHVDADGRHITAVAAQGRQRWVRNPFVDRDMCPYRDAHPSIDWIGPLSVGWDKYSLSSKPIAEAKANTSILRLLRNGMAPGYVRAMGRPRPGDRFIGLAFNSSQRGYLDIRNGDFYLMGQN
jgi:hypothetical protein